jgi:integrase
MSVPMAIVVHSRLEVLIRGWIDEKEHRSESQRTRQAYADTLAGFRAVLASRALDLDSGQEIGRDKSLDHDAGEQERCDLALSALAFTSQEYSRLSARGRTLRPATINQRLAIISSFYEYGIRQVLLASNPIDRVGRSKVEAYKGVAHLENEQVAAYLAGIDRASLAGMRDYALLTILLQTGRRLSEVQSLEVRHLVRAGDKVTVNFEHCKGGKSMSDELPYSVSRAVLAWLAAFYGEDVCSLREGDVRPMWVNLAHTRASYGKPLGAQSIADVCQKHLGTSKVHITRHTWAHRMDELGAPASTIQARLGHESLATTGRYLQELKKAHNPFAEKLAAGYGID